MTVERLLRMGALAIAILALVDEGDAERNIGVLHPEVERLRVGEHEQHAAVLGHHAPVHEPRHARVVGRCHFRSQRVPAD